MIGTEARGSRWRAGMAMGWALIGLLLAGHASAGAWSLENPVIVRDFDGSFVGTAVPVSFQEVEDTLAWVAPNPIDEFSLCTDQVFCTIQANDILFFAFEVAPAQGLAVGDALGGDSSESLSDGGWLLEMPDDPATVDPSGWLLCGFAKCLKFENVLPGPGDRTAILVASFDLGEIESIPKPVISIRLSRFVGGSLTPIVPVRVPEPSGPALAVGGLGVLALLPRRGRRDRVG